MANERYEAFNVGGTCWMVKRFHAATGPDDESNYDEAEIWIDTADPQVAIQAAKERESWA